MGSHLTLFLVLQHESLVSCTGTFPLWQCVWGSLLLSLVLDSMYLVLRGGPWVTWTRALYKEIRIHQFAFFYMQTASWTSTNCWKCCLLSTGWFWLLWQRSSDHMNVGSFLGLQFYSVGLLVSLYQKHDIFITCPVVYFEFRDGDFLSHSFIVRNNFCYTEVYVISDKFENCFFYLCEGVSWNCDGDCIESVDWFWHDGPFLLY